MATPEHTQDWLDFDRRHLWHPYTSMGMPGPVYPVIGARGVHIELADGRKLIDAMSSWWSVLHGYNHPRLNGALRDQLDAIAHVMFGGLTHEPAVRLARQLLALTPAPLQRLFFCDSGSVSVEVAIKMALQYCQATGRTGKRRIASLRGAYHGDTAGCMAVCDPEAGMHSMFSGYLPSQLFVQRPTCRFDASFDRQSLAPIAEALATHATELAAVIVEPIAQGAGGMYFYHPEWLAGLRKLCDQHDVLLIHDEIATGFGRTGRMFASEHADICPDIMCLGKALTGGYMSLAATLCTQTVADGISAGPGGGALMHGPTFMANPLACAVASASVTLLEEMPWQPRVRAIEAQLRHELAPLAALDGVADVRVLGAIGVIERSTPIDMAAAHARCGELGVWLRPFGKLVYTMPPYVTGGDDLSRITAAMAELAKL